MTTEILNEIKKHLSAETLHALGLEAGQGLKRRTRHARATRPLEEVQVSQCNFKVTQARGHADSVNAVVAVCAATGAVAAIDVAYDEIPGKGYRTAVEQILKPKRNLGLQADIEAKWNVSGIPEAVVFDDPLCLLGNIGGFLSDIGCSAYYRPAFPQTPKVERLFGLFMHGTAITSPRNARPLRFKNDQEIRQLLHEFVINFYHNQPFVTDGRVETPMEAWTRAVEEHGVRLPADMQ